MKYKKITTLLFSLFLFSNFCANVTENVLVQQGKNYLQNLYRENTQPIPISGDDHLQSIFAIMNYLCSKASEKNEDNNFSSGTIVIEDENWKLHTFLTNYVKREFGENISKEIWITLKSAYPRHSTHFNSYYLYTGKAIKKGILFKSIKKTSPDYIHYGIDLKKEQVLPIESKRHILFGRIGEINCKQLMFVKFEKVGLKSQDAFEHAIELIKYKVKDQIPALQANLLEKLKVALPETTVLRETLNQIAQNINPKDSLIKYRRETVPLTFIGTYIALMFSKESGVTDNKVLEEIKEKSKAFGIQEMIKTMQEFSESKQGTQKWRDALTFLVEEIKNQYPDNWNIRFGNEIILLQKDFVEPTKVVA